jgi:D-3-phosphoglycerate dehydrogenase
MKILIGPSSFGQLDPAPLRLLEKAGLEVVPNPFSRRYSKTEAIELLQGIDGLIAGLEPLDKEVLSQCKSLKALARCGSGMNNVDQEAAKKLNIKVSSTPDGPTQSVAEMTLCGLLSCLRMLPQMNQSLHNGEWDKRIGGLLTKKTVAIIGFGRIGERFSSLLSPFEVNILAVDLFRKEYPVGVKCVSFETALQEADVISLHISGEDCLFDQSAFSKCKKGLILLNAARGENVDEKSLCKALEDGTVASSWLDSLPREPYEGPLQKFEQVIMTPHTSSYTLEGRLKMETDCVLNLLKDLA